MYLHLHMKYNYNYLYFSLFNSLNTFKVNVRLQFASTVQGTDGD
jgi:hypothetical protein